MNMKPVVITAIYLFCVCSIANAAKWVHFQRLNSFDGEVCDGTEVSFSKENLKDKGMCLIECSTYASCESIFHVQHTGSCTGCTVIYDSTSSPTGEAVGSIYYLKASFAECPEGWFNILNSCYYITGTMTFEEGVKECQSLNAHPVTIETEEENASLKSKLRLISSEVQELNYFTAYTDAAMENTWVAIDTAEPLTIDDWAHEEPNMGTAENCLAFHKSADFQWVDLGCNVSSKTICEKETLY